MNYTVSFTDFRKNMINYADMANSGKSVTVNDERRGIPLFKIVKADEDNFDWDEYMKWIDNFKPFLTDNGVKSMKRFRDSFNKRLEEARNR
ncbi:MAG: hypothetical protein AAB778_00670 [Patescibacteria group bacterium]